MSRVQFNLLPDSKLQYNRTERTKRLVFTNAIIISCISFGILVLMLIIVDGVQKKLLSDSAAKVDKASKQLESLDVDKIVTVQNQLQALVGLHQNKHISSRIFTYLPEITPPNVKMDKLDLDLTKNALTLSGTAPTQKDVNTFVDSLKYATFTVGESKPQPAFKSVVESGFSITSSGVGYTISMEFEPTLFANTKNDQGKPVTPKLSVDESSFNSPLKTPSSTGSQ
jgi:Tfp pilus assembly protein PilN